MSRDLVEAWLVERLEGEGYGRPRKVLDARIWDASDDTFWAKGAQARHRVTALVPAQALTDLQAELDGLREALESIRDKEWVENCLDPQWAADRARQALSQHPHASLGGQ